MSDQQLHHLFNHLPSIGLIMGALVMLISILWKKSQASVVGACIIVFSALSVFPANKTGEDTEDKIENIAGVNEESIHEHEEAAEQVIPFAIAAGIFALLFLVAKGRGYNWSALAATGTLLVSGVAIYFLIVASHKGGLIRHPELDQVSVSSPANASGEEDEDD